MTRAQTEDGVRAIPEHDERIVHVAIPWGKWVALALGIITMFITTMGIIWGAAVLITNKADKSEVRRLEDKMHTIREELEDQLNPIKTDVEVIRQLVERAHGKGD
jgi:hypothetical protein